MKTTRPHPTSRELASNDRTIREVDAGIAATRRIQHLSVIVRDSIDDPENLTRETLAKAVVKALYDNHPHIHLEDALELARLVKTPPPDTSTTQAIQHVTADACAHLDEWSRPQSPTHLQP